MRFINLIYMRYLQYRVKMFFYLVMDPTFGSASTNPGAVLTPLKNKKSRIRPGYCLCRRYMLEVLQDSVGEKTATDLRW